MPDSCTDLASVLAQAIGAALESDEALQGPSEIATYDFCGDDGGGITFELSVEHDWRQAVLRGVRASNEEVVALALAELDARLNPAWQVDESFRSRPQLIEGLLATLASIALAGVSESPVSCEDIRHRLTAPVSDLTAFCEAESFTAGYAMPLVGLAATEPLMQLDDNVRIREVGSTERHDIWQRLARGRVVGHALMMEAQDLKSVGAQLEMVCEFPAGGHLDMRVVQHRWSQGLEAVRLSTAGPVFAPWQFPVADRHEPYVMLTIMGGVGRTSRQMMPTPELRPIDPSIHGVWQIEAGIDSKLGAEDKVRFDRARRRFRDAYDRRSSEDRLIDCWIALESLVLSDSTQELGYKAALRIAQMIGEGSDERVHLFTHVKRLYGARSKVAHGSNVSRPSEQAEDIHEIFRRTLLTWMTLSDRSTKAMDEALLR